MADGILRWAKSQRKIWTNEIKLLVSGRKKTSEVRNGKIIDTTAETLDDRRIRLSELEAFIGRHEDS